MNKPIEALYSVAFRHLSSDAKKSGSELPDVQLHYLSLTQIRALLESAATLAPKVTPPAEPELRITGESGKFVVQIRAGNLNFVSWSSSKKTGGKHTPAQIVALIAGDDSDDQESAAVAGASSGSRQLLPSMRAAA